MATRGIKVAGQTEYHNAPAGNLERGGFFLRQFKRNGTRGAWAFVAQAKWVFGAIGVAVCALMLVTYLLHVSA